MAQQIRPVRGQRGRSVAGEDYVILADQANTYIDRVNSYTDRHEQRITRRYRPQYRAAVRRFGNVVARNRLIRSRTQLNTIIQAYRLFERDVQGLEARSRQDRRR